MLEVVYALWRRDMIKFLRDRRQLITSLTRPFLWLLAFGFGLRASVRLPTGGADFVSFLVPGLAAMTVLFASMFAAISIVWEREFGFLKELLVAPVPRSAIVLGKVLGGTTLAALQGLIFLLLAPLAGVHVGLAALPLIVLTVFLVSFALTALGFAIAWPMDSTSAFHAIINLFLIPLWLLSGALFPLSGASGWLKIVMRINPLTYGVEALRALLYPDVPTDTSLAASMATLVLFSLFMFGLAFVVANRRSTKPAA